MIDIIFEYFEYKFSDGTIFKLLEQGFSENEISKMSSLHGKLISMRYVSYEFKRTL